MTSISSIIKNPLHENVTSFPYITKKIISMSRKKSLMKNQSVKGRQKWIIVYTQKQYVNLHGCHNRCRYYVHWPRQIMVAFHTRFVVKNNKNVLTVYIYFTGGGVEMWLKSFFSSRPRPWLGSPTLVWCVKPISRVPRRDMAWWLPKPNLLAHSDIFQSFCVGWLQIQWLVWGQLQTYI